MIVFFLFPQSCYCFLVKWASSFWSPLPDSDIYIYFIVFPSPFYLPFGSRFYGNHAHLPLASLVFISPNAFIRAGLIEMHALFSGGLPPRTQDCCQRTPEAHRGPVAPSLPPLSPTAAPTKCQHLFSIKRVIVSVKRNCSAASRLWAHEKKLPPLFFTWLRATAGENGSKASSAHDKPQAVRLVLTQRWIYATISQLCTEAFIWLLKSLSASRLLSYQQKQGALFTA